MGARRRLSRLTALLLLVVLLSGCGGTAIDLSLPELPPIPAAEGLRVAVASDLHLNPDYTESSEGDAAAYSLELMDALLRDVREQGAQLLLLTGDLVNGGKENRHEALLEKLRGAEAAGLAVYVLPGNHDLAPIGQAEFAALYADFGYVEAYSRDAASLSYCVLRGDCALLMLDTGGYPADCIDLPGAAPREDSEAFLREETLCWAEEMLQEAQRRALPVLCAGHYNLLTGAERSGYQLENGEALAALLRAYGVPLYLSGHIHLRAVLREEGLTELVTEYLLGYPTGYSLLDREDGGWTYRPRRVDVDAWAAETGQSDPALLHFAAWQQEGLRRYAVENVAYMSARNELSERQQAQAAAFFYAAMNAYWRGTLSKERAALEAMPGYQPFFRCAEGYAYGWWLRDLIETATPELAGFTLPPGG